MKDNLKLTKTEITNDLFSFFLKDKTAYLTPQHLKKLLGVSDEDYCIIMKKHKNDIRKNKLTDICNMILEHKE